MLCVDMSLGKALVSVIESARLEETFKIIGSNHQTVYVNPCGQLC